MWFVSILHCSVSFEQIYFHLRKYLIRARMGGISGWKDDGSWESCRLLTPDQVKPASLRKRRRLNVKTVCGPLELARRSSQRQRWKSQPIDLASQTAVIHVIRELWVPGRRKPERHEQFVAYGHLIHKKLHTEVTLFPRQILKRNLEKSKIYKISEITYFFKSEQSRNNVKEFLQ